jgi:mediator of RNA polymerase II transcription subunit 7
MADEIASTFPLPPPYYHLYKDPNISRLSSSDTLSPPPPPPPPLPSQTYVSFGITYTVPDEVFEPPPPPPLPSLSSLPSSQIATVSLSPNTQVDRKAELRKLCKSLIFSFAQLLQVLVNDQEHFMYKTSDIDSLFIHISYLLNSFRPHQTRQAIISIFEEQVREKEEMEKLGEELQKKTKLVIDQLASSCSFPPPPPYDSTPSLPQYSFKLNDDSAKEKEDYELLQEIIQKEIGTFREFVVANCADSK